MAIELNCRDLGIHNCDWVARGETPGDVVEQVVDHVRKKHDIDLPDADTIMEGDFFEETIGGAPDPFGGTPDAGAATIVRRLREALNLEELDNTPDAGPVAGRLRSP